MSRESENPGVPQFAFSTNGRLYGFDSLFRNNRLVWTEEHPFVLVVWGPEGSGKSTLALELACLGQVTKVTLETPPSKAERPAPLTRCVLYYVTDPVALPRIIHKYRDFHLDRFKEQGHPVLLKDWETDRCPSCQATSLFIRRYDREHQIDNLIQFIREDIDQIIECSGGADALAQIDEFTVVVDGIAGLDLPKAAGAPTGPKEAPVSTIWSSVLIPLESKPLVVILVDELNAGTVYRDRNPYLANVYLSNYLKRLKRCCRRYQSRPQHNWIRPR